MSIKVKFGNGPYVDGNKRLCSYIVITNKNIIFFHRMYFQRGWRWRDKFALNSISEINAATKKISASEQQVVRLCTVNHIYEFFLWYTNKNKELFLAQFNAIKEQIEQGQ